MIDIPLADIQKLIDDEVEVWAIVSLGVNDYVIMPTTITSVTYEANHAFTGLGGISVNTKLKGTYVVTSIELDEYRAVKTLKEKRSLTGLGEFSNYVVQLYKYKYPELWV